jgi:hypothetical protein
VHLDALDGGAVQAHGVHEGVDGQAVEQVAVVLGAQPGVGAPVGIVARQHVNELPRGVAHQLGQVAVWAGEMLDFLAAQDDDLLGHAVERLRYLGVGDHHVGQFLQTDRVDKPSQRQIAQCRVIGNCGIG